MKAPKDPQITFWTLLVIVAAMWLSPWRDVDSTLTYRNDYHIVNVMMGDPTQGDIRYSGAFYRQLDKDKVLTYGPINADTYYNFLLMKEMEPDKEYYASYGFSKNPNASWGIFRNLLSGVLILAALLTLAWYSDILNVYNRCYHNDQISWWRGLFFMTKTKPSAIVKGY